MNRNRYIFLFIVIPLLALSIGYFVACDKSDESDKKESSGKSDDDDDDNDNNDDNNDNDDNDDDNQPETVWTDPDSGLMWQAGFIDERFTWSSAIDHCNSLVYGGYDNWRLPSISELRTLVRGCPDTQTDGDCGVTDSCTDIMECWSFSECLGCILDGGPASGGCYWPDQIEGDESNEISPCYYPYWSSTEDTFYSYYSGPSAWIIFFYNAGISSREITSKRRARCVR